MIVNVYFHTFARLIIQTHTEKSDATVKLAEVEQDAESAQSVVEKPVSMKISAEQALASILDVKIAVDGVISAVSGLALAIVVISTISISVITLSSHQRYLWKMFLTTIML